MFGAFRFYPLYPPPMGTCLDLTGDAALELQQLPDLMLLPSDLAPFAKTVTAAAATEAGGAFQPAAAEGERAVGGGALHWCAEQVLALVVTHPLCLTHSPVAVHAGADTAPRVVVINPGRLAKGSAGGTYAHITVAEGSGSIADRCRVDICRV